MLTNGFLPQWWLTLVWLMVLVWENVLYVIIIIHQYVFHCEKNPPSLGFDVKLHLNILLLWVEVNQCMVWEYLTTFLPNFKKKKTKFKNDYHWFFMFHYLYKYILYSCQQFCKPCFPFSYFGNTVFLPFLEMNGNISF